MTAVRVFEVVFALAVVGVAVLVAATATARASRSLLVGVASAVGVVATAAWIAVALDPTEALALAAVGVTGALVAAAATLPLQRAIDRNRGLEADAAAWELRLRRRMEELAEENAAELERLVARTRADTISLLGEEERRIAEDRRRLISEQERRASSELAEALAAVQRRVEGRLGAWTDDLERTQQKLSEELERLAERQRVVVADAEARIAADVNRLAAGSEEERAAVARLREELGRAAEQVVTQSAAELEAHGAERRQALQELATRLRRREQELAERIEREEAEATARVTMGLADAERRTLEQLTRANERAVASFADAAGQQFADAIRAAREDAARRLARELDRAVESFSREAQTALADRLGQVGDAGVRRVERRLASVAESLERHRDELAASLDQRLAAAEAEIRARLTTIARDAEAERAILDGRLQDLSHRIDDAVSSARERLARLEELRTR